MKKEKMSLATIQGKLSRTEMKNIMAGSGTTGGDCANRFCSTNSDCCTSFPNCTSIGNWPGKMCSH